MCSVASEYHRYVSFRSFHSTRIDGLVERRYSDNSVCNVRFLNNNSSITWNLRFSHVESWNHHFCSISTIIFMFQELKFLSVNTLAIWDSRATLHYFSFSSSSIILNCSGVNCNSVSILNFWDWYPCSTDG